MTSEIEQKIEEQIKVIRKGVEEIISEDELRTKLRRSLETKKPLRIKQGFDPTAPDIHLGHSIGLRKLRDFQRLGHIVVLVIGDYTGVIGDPSGRSKARPRLTKEQIEANAATYLEQFSKIVDPERTEVKRNSEWLGKLTFLDMINLLAMTTVARIIERDDFEKRFKSKEPIGLHEMVYPVMQAYDSVAIHADVELGGTEQKFNLLLGRQYQESLGQEPQIAITLPILEGINGVQKMSKSLGNYVGIAEDPNQMFGKIMSIPDSLIVRYFRLTTDLDDAEIRKIERDLSTAAVNPKDIKSHLAHEVVMMYHGKKKADIAKDEFEKRFGSKRGTLDLEGIQEITIKVEGDSIWIVELLRRAGVAKSGSEARRKIMEGAVRIDNETVHDIDARIEVGGGRRILRIGKRFVKFELKKDS